MALKDWKKSIDYSGGRNVIATWRRDVFRLNLIKGISKNTYLLDNSGVIVESYQANSKSKALSYAKKYMRTH